MKKIILLSLLLVSATASLAHQHHIPQQKPNKHKHRKMENKDFTTTIQVNKSPAEAMEAIKNFRAWWSEDIEGETGKLNETFFYHYKDVHLCKIKLVEEVPGKKLVYRIVDNQFSFVKDKTEWVNTELVFDLAQNGATTRVDFTHKGLVPQYECYDVCHDAWTGFIRKSLKEYINTGTGQPNPKDGTNQINAENIQKWKIGAATEQPGFSFNFETSKPPAEVYALLANPNNWWTGLYDEHIDGAFAAVGDEFTYKAGGGMHYSEQKVTELIPGQKISWLITKSELTFLHQKDEWNGTTISMAITPAGNKTRVVFQHLGLVPAIECYGACSGAWTQYMEKLEKAWNN